MRLDRLTIATAVLCAVTGTVAADDAEVASDDSMAIESGLIEGRGFQISPGWVLHPSVGLLGGASDNVFNETRDESPVAAGMMRLIATLHIATDNPTTADMGEGGDAELTPQTVVFRGGLSAAYQEFLSGNELVRSQRNLNLEALADLVVYPQGRFAFILQDHFVRDSRSPNYEDNSTLRRDDNRLTLGLRLQPQSQNIATELSYTNWLQIFESGAPSQFANRMNHTLKWNLDFQWRALTKFTAQVSYGFYGPLGDSQLAGEAYKTSSQPFRAVAGLATLLTELTTLKLYAGYTRATYERGPGYSAPAGGAELGVRWSEHGRVVASYEYEHYDSLNANFYRDHAITAKLVHRINFAVVDVGPEIRFRKFGGIAMALGQPERTDFVAALSARIQLAFADKYSVSAEYRLASVQTDYVARAIDEMGNLLGTDDPSYLRNDFLVGVRAAF